jgi:hypothetical protein
MADAPKTREQLEKEWWDAWWAEDYSWDGLATKAWVGWVVDTADQSIHEADAEPVKAAPEGRFRDATLQDYWRGEEGDLIASPDGKLKFTRVHLPPAWRDGMPTGKGEWRDDALDVILAPRLASGKKTTVDMFDASEGADHQTQLSGAMLLSASTNPQDRSSPVHLKCQRTRFLARANFAEQVFGPDVRFENAAFSNGAMFYSATFSGDARFGKVTFFGDAWFGGATFSGEAEFQHTTFLDGAWFDSATFSGDATFASAAFSSHALFDSTTFSGEARFNNAAFFRDAMFRGATFSGNARFDFASFSADAWFVARAYGPTSFLKLASFDSAIFKAPARFKEAHFLGRMSFDKTLFESVVDFSQAELPQREEHWRAAFDGSLFQRSLDLRGVGPKTASLVSGAVFDRGVLLERTDEGVETKAHREALKLASAAEDREDALKALESGALKLKQAMHVANDVAREQRFYRLELRARRKQKGTKGTEKFFSLLYAGTSKYGGSIGWPFLWLATVIVGFAALYLAVEGQLKPPEPRSVFESLRYSLSRVIPLGTWDESDDPLRVKVSESEAPIEGEAGRGAQDCSFRERLMASDDCRPDLKDAELEAYRLALSALATFQTVIAAALYFLLALAVRRKFQIA